VQALLKAGADPTLTDETGFTALDYARRKLAKLQSRKPRRPPQVPPVTRTKTIQLQLQPRSSRARPDAPGTWRRVGRSHPHLVERAPARGRLCQHPEQVEKIVAMLEARGSE